MHLYIINDAVARQAAKFVGSRHGAREMQLVDRHGKPSMDLTGNKSMSWLPRQWVLDSEIPRCSPRYEVRPGGAGNQIAMPVPSQMAPQGRVIRLGRVTLAGSQSKPVEVKLPFKPTKVMLNAYKDILEQN